PDLFRMAHAARFEQIEDAIAFAVRFDVAQRYPGVHQRGYAALALAHLIVDRRQAGEHHRDALGLADIGEPDERRMDFSRRAAKGGYRIDDNSGGLELL